MFAASIYRETHAHHNKEINKIYRRDYNLMAVVKCAACEPSTQAFVFPTAERVAPSFTTAIKFESRKCHFPELFWSIYF